MYAGLTKFTRKITVGKFSKVSVADPELALMDSLIEREARNGSIERILLKFLDRFGKTLRRDVLGKLVGLRYITSINRLKLFAHDHKLDPIASLCLDIIKKEGGNCFVSAKKSSMKQD